jgi:hypothetical protein
MAIPEDIPDFPFPKPLELENLEQLPADLIHAMTPVEVGEKIRDAAASIARSYMQHTPSSQANYEECFILVSSSLTEIGHSIPGQLGNMLVGTSRQAAEEASGQFFPDETLKNG